MIKSENQVTKRETYIKSKHSDLKKSEHEMVLLQLRGLEVTFNIVGEDREEVLHCWNMMTEYFKKALGMTAGFPGFAMFGLGLDMRLLDYKNTKVSIEAVNPATRILKSPLSEGL